MQKQAQASTKSVAAVGVVTALVTGALLWAYRPAPTGKIVPLLLRVSSASGPPDLRVMNGASGSFFVEVTGGETNASGPSAASVGEPVPESRITWRYSGPLSRLKFQDILQHGDRTGTAAQIPLPAPQGGRLEPGSYIIEISGRDSSGNIYAGAQSFSVRSPAGNSIG